MSNRDSTLSSDTAPYVLAKNYTSRPDTATPEDIEMRDRQPSTYDGFPDAAMNPASEDVDPADLVPPKRTMTTNSVPGFGTHYTPGEVTGWDTVKRNLPSAMPGLYQAVELRHKFHNPLTAEQLRDMANNRNSKIENSASPGKAPLMKGKSRMSLDPGYMQEGIHGSPLRKASSTAPRLERQKTIRSIEKEKAMVKTQGLKMQDKKAVVQEKKQAIIDQGDQISKWMLIWLSVTHFFQRTWDEFTQTLYRSAIWQGRIKKIEGGHGTHVGIYFTFLRWCLLLNVLLGFIWLLFVISPYLHFFSISDGLDDQRPNPRPEYTDYNAGELFTSWFTGIQPLNHSAYFIGAYYMPYDDEAQGGRYDNHINDEDHAYKIPLAYVSTGGAYMLVSFVLVFYGLYKSWVKSAVSFERGDFRMAELVLSSYDHTLTSEKSIKVHQKALAEKMKEILGEHELSLKYSQLNRTKVLLKRLFINIIIIGTLAGCIFAIIRTVEEYADAQGLERLVPAIVMAFMNAAVPFFFEILAEAEDWRSLLFVIKITVLRSILLRFVSLYAFMITLYRNRFEYSCWETFVGQGSYTLFVAGSLVFEIFTSGFIDIWVTLLHYHVPCAKLLLKDPAYFDTIKKILELTYAQAVIWFGTFFCPLLPFVGIARCIVLFYVQEWSTMTWCTPKGTPFQAGHSLPWLIWTLLATCLFIVALPLGYLVSEVPPSGVYSEYNDWFMGQTLNLTNSTTEVIPTLCNESSFPQVTCADCLVAPRNLSQTVCYEPNLEQLSSLYPNPWVDTAFANGFSVTYGSFCEACPSGCGPFRNKELIISPIQDSFSTWPKGVQDAINFMGTAPFTLILIFLFLSILSCLSARSDARQKRADKLRAERDVERADKLWLLREYDLRFQPKQRTGLTPTPMKEEDENSYSSWNGRGVDKNSEGPKRTPTNSPMMKRKNRSGKAQITKGSGKRPTEEKASPDVEPVEL